LNYLLINGLASKKVSMKKKQDSGKGCANLVLLIMIIPVVIFVSWLFDGIGWGLLMGFILFMVGSGGDF